MTRPVVGITLDSEEPGGYSRFPWYAARRNYAAAVAAAGGLPVLLPHETARAGDYADRVSALVVTGGAFDIDPAMFGAGTRHPSVTLKEGRTEFERAVTEEILARDRPVLGICGGHQLLNVLLGGTLVQHIPDEIENALAHEQPNSRDEPGHDVTVAEGTLLGRIAGAGTRAVNSAHHQAAAETGPGVVVNATAPDGVVEGIEAPERRFCLGVQWHPEFGITPADPAIFRALVAAAEDAP